ncbi:MAG: bifunctional riboflavin kinase/FAD synthetase [Oscillospiraceae bacterium]
MSANAVTKKVIALGFFDGVHRGHAELIKMAKRRAEEISAVPAVLSFDVSPESIVSDHKIPLIGSTETRTDIVRRIYGVDSVIIYHFDKKIMAMPWREFINSLIEQFSAIHFVIGHDFHCGFKGEGNPQRISDYCAELGIGCDIIPKFTLDGITVSSTYIRALIADGNIERANYFLGHPYVFTGTVCDGRKVGRRLGSPTINLSCNADLLLPPFGVYATRVIVDNNYLPAVTNVGIRPTFDDRDEPSIESYILNFNGNLYGKFVRVEFFKFLRTEKKFENADKLSEQIQKDADAAGIVMAEIPAQNQGNL